MQLHLGPGDAAAAELSTKQRRLLAKSARELCSLQHRCSALGLLGRGLLMDAACELPAVHAALLSLDPPLENPGGTGQGMTCDTLRALASWTVRTFTVAAVSHDHLFEHEVR